MNTKVKFLLTAAFLTMLTFFACKKDRVQQDDYQSMDSFYSDNEEEEQELQVDSGSGGSCFVTAKKGTLICIRRDQLRDAGGNDIPSYPFQLKVIELYSIKDMILRKQPSTAGGGILETSAEIKVRPFKDGNEAYLKDGAAYQMLTDTFPSVDSARVCYYGFVNGGVGDWTNSLATLIPGFIDTLSSVTAIPNNYYLTPATTGYVSAARSHTTSAQYTTVTLSVVGNNTQNIEVYIRFNNFKSVMKVTNLVSAPIPVGESVTLVAFGRKQNNDYVIHQQSFTVTAGQQITLNMQLTSQSGILAALAAL